MSLAGLYGLSNPTVTWLIGRGYGELVALMPEELRTGVTAPLCPRPHRGSTPRMLYRGSYWLCPDHEPPYRQRIPLQAQRLPPCPWRAVDCVGYEVDIQYRRESGEARPSWKWSRRRL